MALNSPASISGEPCPPKKSGKGIFRGIGQGGGPVIGDVPHAQQAEGLKERAAVVPEGHRAVVGIALLQQHMSVEASHLRDGEDADAAEGAGSHRQHLALGDVGPQNALAVALDAVEGNVAGGDVPLQGAPGEVGLAAVLQQPVLDGVLPQWKPMKVSVSL